MPNRSPVEDAPMDVVDNDFMALDACKMKLPPEAYQQLNDHCCRMIVDHMVKMHYERVFRQIKPEAEKLGVHASKAAIVSMVKTLFPNELRSVFLTQKIVKRVNDNFVRDISVYDVVTDTDMILLHLRAMHEDDETTESYTTNTDDLSSITDMDMLAMMNDDEYDPRRYWFD